MHNLPPLIEKALNDAGFDLIHDFGNGWFQARSSGSINPGIRVQPVPAGGALLQTGTLANIGRIGLEEMVGKPGIGLAHNAGQLREALRSLHTLEVYSANILSARVEKRLAAIQSTERTQEVRRRIGQDVFREALFEFWDRRCALTGAQLLPSLLRASHAKPWAAATEHERLDPFNGLLLSVHYDALFDQGFISFADNGRICLSPQLNTESQHFLCIFTGMKLQRVLPGHLPYLRYHRECVLRR